MHVVATAGHVDHGKSTLVRALTGMEPDRWAEERRRGMTIDLGFAWTTLPSGADVAFVDVPGHERFLTNMLAGVGSVPAAIVVVAADEGWMPQTAEHVAALDALRVRHLLLVVTKTDLADPTAVIGDVRDRLTGPGRGHVEAVAVNAVGTGLDGVRAALDRLVATLPAADPEAPVRLWVDRAFTISGAGTVVTGTLPAGRVRVGDELELWPAGRRVAVRAVQSRKTGADEVCGVARVALNLRAVDRDEVERGMALTTPAAWAAVDLVDVLLDADRALPTDVVAHLGAAAEPAQLRPLGGRAARLRLRHRLPMHVGDRLLLRHPASRAIAGAVVADVSPTPLSRRGDAAKLAASLTVPATADDELARRGVVTVADLVAAGFREPPSQGHRVGQRWVAQPLWERWLVDLPAAVRAQADPATGDVPLDAVRALLGLPDAEVVAALVAASPALVSTEGRARHRDSRAEVPAELLPLVERLQRDPFDAPTGMEVRALGGDALAAAVRLGLVRHLGGGVYVGPAAPDQARELLATLPEPFAVSAATQALGASRRVVVPLLEHLDAARQTRRLPDGTRVWLAVRR